MATGVLGAGMQRRKLDPDDKLAISVLYDTYKSIPSCAKDLAIGANGDVWATATLHFSFRHHFPGLMQSFRFLWPWRRADADSAGAIVNASRTILYASARGDWQAAARAEAEKLRAAINTARAGAATPRR